MSPIDELIPVLKKLRLSGVLQSLELRIRQSVEGDVHPAEFLLRVLHDEVKRREGKQLDQRLRCAAFEPDKTFENFDFLFNPQVPKAKVIDLATCCSSRERRTCCSSGKVASASRISHRRSGIAPASQATRCCTRPLTRCSPRCVRHAQTEATSVASRDSPRSTC